MKPGCYAGLSLVVALLLSGCDAALDSLAGGGSSSASWGELGGEKRLGPYRICVPSKFEGGIPPNLPPGAVGRQWKAPGGDKSLAAITAIYLPHGIDVEVQEPNWHGALEGQTSPMRQRFRNFSLQPGQRLQVNGLEGIRAGFSGELQHGGQTHPLRGVVLILMDSRNYIALTTLGFGPQAADLVSKLEPSLKTFRRADELKAPPTSSSPKPDEPAGPGETADSSGTPEPPGRPAHFPEGLPDPDDGPPRARPVDESPAADPQHPDYFKENLADLRSSRSHRRDSAVKRMAKADPAKVADPELRKGIARAMKSVAFDDMVSFTTRADAVEGLVTWGSTYSVPLLLELLERDHQPRPVRQAVYRALTELKDERAIEPVAKRFAAEVFERDDAAECLRAFGSKAEDAVLKYGTANDLMMARATVRLLAEIGTKKSLGPLKTLGRARFARLLQADIQQAVQAINERSRKSKTRP